MSAASLVSNACSDATIAISIYLQAFARLPLPEVDVDAVPKAAYDMEVQDVPTVAVLPIGLKPDGAPYDKTDLQVAHCSRSWVIPSWSPLEWFN